MWPALPLIYFACHPPPVIFPRWRRNNISVNKVILVGRWGAIRKLVTKAGASATANRVHLFSFLSPIAWSSILACDEVDGAPFGPRLLQVCH